jgi:hypothetical protein
MKPFYVVVKGTLPLMIVPDTDAGIELHPTLVRSYQIYRHCRNLQVSLNSSGGFKDVNHLGGIQVLIPGRSYHYIPNALGRLSFFEVRDLVDEINNYRDTPAVWQLSPLNSLAYYMEMSNSILRRMKFTIAAFEQRELSLREQSILIGNITSLRAEYNLIQTEIISRQASHN